MSITRFFAERLLATPSRISIQSSCLFIISPPKLLQRCRQFSSTLHQCKHATPIPRNPVKCIISKQEVVHNYTTPKVPFYGKVRFRSTVSRKEKSKPHFRSRWLVGGVLVVLATGSTFGPGFLESEQRVFDPPRFTPFTIIKREVVSPTSIILTLQPGLTPPRGSPADLYKEWWERGIWSVEVKQPELQIARSYTPLPSLEPDEVSDLRLLIRKEHKGEVSGYMHKLAVGSKIELRGPHLGFKLPEHVGEVLFLAGGTGIAPAMQVAYTLLERRTAGGDQTKVRIVWSNRRREDCEGGGQMDNKALLMDERTGQIVQELAALQQRHPGQLTIDYLVDEENTFLDQGGISRTTTESGKTQTGPKLLFISGPEGFVNFFAGPKKWEGGKEGQGDVAGVLGRMSLKDWTVWKL